MQCALCVALGPAEQLVPLADVDAVLLLTLVPHTFEFRFDKADQPVTPSACGLLVREHDVPHWRAGLKRADRQWGPTPTADHHVRQSRFISPPPNLKHASPSTLQQVRKSHPTFFSRQVSDPPPQCQIRPHSPRSPTTRTHTHARIGSDRPPSSEIGPRGARARLARTRRVHGEPASD